MLLAAQRGAAQRDARPVAASYWLTLDGQEVVMFGMGSARVRAGMVATVLVATVALTVVVVQASASGTRAAKATAVTKRLSVRLSLKQGAEAAQTSLRSQARPQASAIVANVPSTVSCGQRLTASTTLTANLDCNGENGLILEANGIVLNLNGHSIIGSVDMEDSTIGVADNVATDTIENGYIEGFELGARVTGATDTTTNLQVNYAHYIGILLQGIANKATSDTAAENFGDGIFDDGTGDTVQSDHLLNNEGNGLIVDDSGAKVLDNVADGNTFSGIGAYERLATLTGNTANYNGELGLDAASPMIDGGSNKAMGNGTKEQCRGVVCS
jgi:hypothetical protein